MTSVVKRNKNRGKEVEKKVAKLFGGDRIGIFGKTDVIIKERYSIEVKSRVGCVANTFMNQSVTNCVEGTIPLVYLHIKGKHVEDDLLMVRMKDMDTLVSYWKDGHGDL